jgi:hypothetical protein
MGAGVASLFFALVRTYYLVRREKKRRELPRRRTHLPTDIPESNDPE